MSVQEIACPDIGDFKDVLVIEVLVQPGDVIGLEAPVVTLETDKATMDVPATVAGRVVEVLVTKGSKVSQGRARTRGRRSATGLHRQLTGNGTTARKGCSADHHTRRGRQAGSRRRPRWCSCWYWVRVLATRPHSARPILAHGDAGGPLAGAGRGVPERWLHSVQGLLHAASDRRRACYERAWRGL